MTSNWTLCGCHASLWHTQRTAKALGHWQVTPMPHVRATIILFSNPSQQLRTGRQYFECHKNLLKRFYWAIMSCLGFSTQSPRYSYQQWCIIKTNGSTLLQRMGLHHNAVGYQKCQCHITFKPFLSPRHSCMGYPLILQRPHQQIGYATNHPSVWVRTSGTSGGCHW